MTNDDDKGRKPYEKVYRGGGRRRGADDELAGLRPGRERRSDADRRKAGTGVGGERFDWGVPREGRAAGASSTGRGAWPASSAWVGAAQVIAGASLSQIVQHFSGQAPLGPAQPGEVR